MPEIIEILINSYSQIPISEKWVEAVPEEVLQVRLNQKGPAVQHSPSPSWVKTEAKC